MFNEKKELNKVELMVMPEIRSGISYGYFWYTFLQKAVNPNWDIFTKEKNNFSEQIENFFLNHPIESALLQRWQEFYEKIDMEIAGWFALAIDHPNILPSILETCLKHKEHKNLNKENASELFEEFKAILNEFRAKNSDLESVLKFKEDNLEANNLLEEKEMLAECLEYFKPKKQTSNLRSVIFLTDNDLIKNNTGWGFRADDKGYIVSHKNNRNNQRHEFLHFLINPIIEKIEFSEEEKKKIIEMAGQKMVVELNYGENATSLLNEALIRVFNEIKSNNYKTFQDYLEKIAKLSEEKFGQIKIDEAEVLAKLNIKTLGDFKERATDIYYARITSTLNEKVYQLYLDYDQLRKNNFDLTFEDYFLENYKKLFL